MLALLFPGQGSQEVGMGQQAAAGSRAARAVFERADAALGFPLSRLCFEGPEEELRRTELQQPAILVTSVALLRALEERSEVPVAYLAGHSLGEYTALVAAGALELEDAVALVHARGRYMQEAVPEGRGAMAALIGCDADVAALACELARKQSGGVVSPANYNAPQQTAIAGDLRSVELASSEARRLGARRVVPLAVSAPFHCALMEPAADKLAGELAAVRVARPRVPVLSNVDAEPNDDPERVPGLLRRQVTAPVRFTDSVRRLVELGVTRVLEVGPGRVLTGLVGRIDRGLRRAGLGAMDDLDEAAAFVAAH